MPEASSIELQPDCEKCCGLCCVAPAFAASSDFAINKPAGIPCPKLTTEFRCSIHQNLRPEGFSGCIAYDCFGAGQKVTQLTFKGRTWRSSPKIAGQMFDVFGVMQQLHSMLNYLAEALEMEPARPLLSELRGRFDEIRALSEGTPDDLMTVDLRALRLQTDGLLLRVGELVRTP
ncbi:MAG: hypothetical protein WD178_02960 [Actinomycetota bacterium]